MNGMQSYRDVYDIEKSIDNSVYMKILAEHASGCLNHVMVVDVDAHRMAIEFVTAEEVVSRTQYHTRSRR